MRIPLEYYLMSLLTVAYVSCQWVQRKTAVLEGDITIGALFSIHEQPDQKMAHTRNCGKVWEEYGIQRAEVTFQTIDAINRDPSLLPNITLGVEIRDECWYAPVALEQSLEFIRDAISATRSAAASNQSLQACPAGGASSSTCQAKRKNIVGVIGPGSSAISIQVQNLLQLFHIPQIGYSATSRDLSDKNRFRYFMRVVPPDNYQAKAMVDIVKKYNWTYVSAVSTEGSYGQSGIQAFREYAEVEEICIAKDYSILSNANPTEYDKLLSRLLEEHKARVIVCFCEGETVTELLKAIRKANKTGHFLLLGSDGWADRLDVVEGYENEANGGISIRIHSPHVPTFDDYYFSLKPDEKTKRRNPWFEEFWEQKFECTFPTKTRKGSSAKEANFLTKTCSGRESLRNKYKQDSKLGFVIKALYAMAWGLHNLQQQVCGESGLCPAMLPINGSLLRDHLMNVSFSYGNETVQFDENGNPPSWYDIMNFSNDTHKYEQIGTWKEHTLQMDTDPITPMNSGSKFKSVCSEPCEPGEKKIIQKQLSCCWKCVPCDPHQYLLDETTCKDCQLGFKPNDNKTDCLEIAADYLTWTDRETIAVVSIAVVGIMATLVVASIFIYHNDTPVVKASTRELTYLILLGMILCHVTTLPLVAEPGVISCSFSRILPGLSFSMIYASLLTKTNRIARVLVGKRRIQNKARWLSATGQVAITLVMILVEVGLITVTLILEPADGEKYFPSRSRVQLICNTSVTGLMAPLGFDFFLIGLCTVYAVKTRNLPDNFNESKFIGFSMYTTCVIWLAFVPIYFGSESKVITLCICVSLSALVTLVILFGPKVYIIVWEPEQNTRSKFLSELRVHTIAEAFGHSFHHSSQLARNSTFSVSDASQDQNWIHSCNDGYMQRLASQKQELNCRNSRSSRNGTSQERSNLNLLQRAFGSQIDLTGFGPTVNQVEKRNKCRSTESQTDDELIAGLLEQIRRKRQSLHQTEGNESSDYGSSTTSTPSKKWSITERKAASDTEDMTIIISLTDSNQKKKAGKRRLSLGRVASYDMQNSISPIHKVAYLQSLGITISKGGSMMDIL